MIYLNSRNLLFPGPNLYAFGFVFASEFLPVLVPLEAGQWVSRHDLTLKHRLLPVLHGHAPQVL